MLKTADSSYENLVTKVRPFFWKKGFHNVTSEEVANYLGVSLSLMYKKYDKDILFIDSLNSYVETYTNPILIEIKKSDKGLETFRELFYSLVGAMIDKTFPRSCMLVNSIIETHDTQHKKELVDLYSNYLSNMKNSYIEVLKKAYKAGEIQNESKIESYAEFLTSTLFELTVLYKCKSKEELHEYIDQQLLFIR